MRLLKKASIQDILKEGRENVTVHYKEIELYTSWEDINNLDDNKIECLVNKLNKNNAIISAIHCPESLVLTSSDEDSERSTNYLSICEAIKYEDSREKLKELIKFAEVIYCKQWGINTRKNNEGETIISEKDINKYDKLLLIIHSGCEIGCQKNNENKMVKCKFPKQGEAEDFQNIIKNKCVKIVIENITPYLDSNDITFIKGQNCGWSISDKDQWNCFKLAKRLGVGVCVDICHILATHNIINGDVDYSIALDEYLKYIKDNKLESLISLFHLANYDPKGAHGVQFNDTDVDNKLLEQIRTFCFEIAPTALTTLEVADGQDYEKACRNFDRLMLKLSERHTSGLFGLILNSNNNKDLKQYFDDLYYAYTSDGKDIFELRERAMRIKKYILSNTYITQEGAQINHPFNLSKDSDIFDTAIFRMQAYIYYTRFCNLGMFLANYYNMDSIIDEKNIAEDFALSLKYFMFNDNIKQIEYTGVAFRFNVDWLPQKDTFFRFYDGITENKFVKKSNAVPLPYIIENIRQHVQGDCCLFSCGRNFGMCLFKYWKPLTIKNNWTVRIYDKEPINFIDYNNQRYSIPAFMQLIGDEEIDFNEVSNFSFDMSRFHNGRGDEKSVEKNASSLFSLFRYYTNKITPLELTGSIADGEVVFLELSNENCLEFALSEYSSVVLFKAYLKHLSSKEYNIEEIAKKLDSWIVNCQEIPIVFSLNHNESDLEKVKTLLSKISVKESNTKHELLKHSVYDKISEPINNLFWEIEGEL